MIETYWNEVFGKFKQQSGEFIIPGFPEPLMSAHFGVKNIIGKTDVKVAKSFSLCVLDPLKVQQEATFEPMSEAILRPDFWDFQMEQNTEAHSFIKRLLPFLVTLSIPHYHFFIKIKGEIKASALVGVAETGLFLFNLSVHREHRRQGLSKLILNEIRGSFPLKQAFYWTIHPWFIFEGEAVEYHLNPGSF